MKGSLLLFELGKKDRGYPVCVRNGLSGFGFYACMHPTLSPKHRIHRDQVRVFVPCKYLTSGTSIDLIRIHWWYAERIIFYFPIESPLLLLCLGCALFFVEVAPPFSLRVGPEELVLSTVFSRPPPRGRRYQGHRAGKRSLAAGR